MVPIRGKILKDMKNICTTFGHYGVDNVTLMFADMQHFRYKEENIQRIFEAERCASSRRRLACRFGGLCQVDYRAEPIKSM